MRNESAFRAVLTAALLLAAALSIVLVSTEGECSKTAGDLTVTGDLARQVDVDEYAGVGTLTYTGPGSDVEWYVTDAGGAVYVEVSDGVYEERGYELLAEGAVLTICDPGMYRIELRVGGETVRTGTAVLDGEVTRTFEWTDSLPASSSYHAYSVTFTYMYSDYLSYHCDSDAVRHTSSKLDTARFAVVDDVLECLESLLRAEYVSAGGTVGGQDYADFLLSFVQVCFSYPDTITVLDDGTAVYDSVNGHGDLYLYGAKEYWAYPLETIHMGMGDCEDTSFLAAALFAAAGYDSGVCVLTDHMVAYVALDDFTPRVTGYSIELSVRVLASTGQHIFFCETTTDVYVCVGYVPASVAEEISSSDTKVYPVSGAAA